MTGMNTLMQVTPPSSGEGFDLPWPLMALLLAVLVGGFLYKYWKAR